MSLEWNNGRVTKRPEELLEFHRRKLEKAQTDRQVAYHAERVAHLGQYATVHTLHTPEEQANVLYLDDYRGGNAA